MKNNNKAFTLVELLAVIAVLALILIIAVPKISKTLDNSKKRTLELSVKSIANAAEKSYIENKTQGIKEEITCESVANMSKNEYESCIIKFDTEGNATVTINGLGNYKGLHVCNGTKDNISITYENCALRVLNVDLDGGTDDVNYNPKYEEGSKVTLTEPTKEGYVFKGWSVTGTNASVDGNTLIIGNDITEVKAIWVKLISFTFDDEICQAEEGMTYREWVGSKYNSVFSTRDDFLENSSMINAAGVPVIYSLSGKDVYYFDIIEDGEILIFDTSDF